MQFNVFVPEPQELKIVCADGQNTVEKRLEIVGHQLVTIQGLCKGYIDRFILQGKVEFSARSAGYVLRKMDYYDMLVDPDTIITKEEIEEFETLVNQGKVPSNMKFKEDTIYEG